MISSVSCHSQDVCTHKTCAHGSQDKEERERRERAAQQRRQSWRQLAAAEKELDWQRYGKYDALQQLLASAAEDPAFKVLLLPGGCALRGASRPGLLHCRPA